MTSASDIPAYDSGDQYWPAILALMPVLFFSFIPFLYVIEPLGLNKVAIFVGLSIVSVTVILLQNFRGVVNRKKAISLILYLLFAIYAFANFFFSDYAWQDWVNISNITAINTMAAWLALSCVDNKRAIFYLVSFLCGVYVLMALYSVSTGYLSPVDTSVRNIFPGLKSAEDNNYYQNVSFYLGLFLVLVINGTVWGKTLFVKVTVVFVALFCVYVMLIIGGRAGIVAAIITSVGYIWFLKKSSQFFSRITVLLFLGGIFSSLAVWILPNMLEFEDLGQLPGVRRFAALGDEGDPSLRLSLFSHSLELFLLDAKTFLVGSGIGGFPAFVGDPEMYPHNLILELLAEFGVIGLMLFMSSVIYILLVRKKHLGSFFGSTAEEKSSFTVAMYVWLVAMTTGGIATSWVLVFFTFLLFPRLQQVRYRPVYTTPPGANRIARGS